MTGTTSSETPAALEPWSLRDIWRDYWRVPVIALLAGLVAFAGSFIVPASYVASTRILVRAKDTTVLNSTGTALGNQPGVIDSQLAAGLTDTQAALISNRAVAERVVDQLRLHEIEDDSNGIIAKARRAFAAAYKRTRAILTSGFYKEKEKREAKIDMVQSGLGAKQVEDGWAMDIMATWDDPDIAADIANTAADLLVAMGNERFQLEAEAYRDFLAEQTDKALAAEQAARQALASFKTANNITTTPEQDALLVRQSDQDLAAQIQSTRAELEAARGQVASLRADLARTSPIVTNSQQITTGRSSTNIDSTGQNPVYAQLLGQLQSAEADVQALSARLGALEGARDAQSADAGVLSEQQAELARLQLDVQIASDTRAQLASELEQATINAQRTAVEVTRLDQAVAPTYPVAPKRYLYLGVGGIVGALVGFVWSFLRVQRRQRLALDTDDGEVRVEELEEIDLRDTEVVQHVRGSNGVGVHAPADGGMGSG